MLKEYAQNSNLKKAVLSIALQAYQYSEKGLKESLLQHCEEVTKYGCQSGMVADLIYYYQTTEFFENYKEEISEYLANYLKEWDMQVSDFAWYDEEDPFFIDTHNQNYIAWFTYEAICYDIFNLLQD